MSALNILYYSLTALIIWILILTTIIAVVAIQTLKHIQRQVIRMADAISELKPSNYLNKETLMNIFGWGLKRMFKRG